MLTQLATVKKRVSIAEAAIEDRSSFVDRTADRELRVGRQENREIR